MLCANDLKFDEIIFSYPKETGQFLGLCWALEWSQVPRKWLKESEGSLRS